LGPVERLSLLVVLLGMVWFGAYGLATGAPSTVAYLGTVAALGALTARIWQPGPSPWLAMGLSLLALAHMAGGLVKVGDDVLYNASLGSPALRYDHLVHSSAVFVCTLVLWQLVGVKMVRPSLPGCLAVVALAGLGLGALNETIEFLTTMVQHGTHIGGYTNTGWDLVSNVAGATGAGVVIRRRGLVGR